MCQHKTRETVWLPELIEHANGANGLSAIVAISSDPEAAAKGFARLYANGKAEAQDGGWKVSTGSRSADIWVVSEEKAAAIYPGVDFARTPGKAFAVLRIRVASLDKARGVLDANGISHVKTSAGIAVLPENASGTVLEFSEQ